MVVDLHAKVSSFYCGISCRHLCCAMPGYCKKAGPAFTGPSQSERCNSRSEPTPAAIPTASAEQGNDKNYDEDCGQIHESLQ